SLVWVLPLYTVQGLARLAAYLLTRRFEDAYQLLSAWGWNVAHLPGTIRRRVRAQSVRVVPDRVVRRTMAPAWIRLRRWAGATAPLVLGRRREATGHADLEEDLPPAPRQSVVRIAAAHPAATAVTLAVVLAAISYRTLLSPSPLLGAGLEAMPASPGRLFAEFVSGLRSPGLGG